MKWKEWEGGGCLHPLSPSLFISCITTPVNSSAYSTPTPPEKATLQANQGQSLLGVAWVLSNMAPQVVHVIKCLCEKWANHVDFHQWQIIKLQGKM